MLTKLFKWSRGKNNGHFRKEWEWRHTIQSAYNFVLSIFILFMHFYSVFLFAGSDRSNPWIYNAFYFPFSVTICFLWFGYPVTFASLTILLYALIGSSKWYWRSYIYRIVESKHIDPISIVCNFFFRLLINQWQNEGLKHNTFEMKSQSKFHHSNTIEVTYFSSLHENACFIFQMTLFKLVGAFVLR